jgi:methylated-DNA-[protein]-cysteine S-methyltransferase
MENSFYYTILKGTPAGNLFIAGSDRGLKRIEFNAGDGRKCIVDFKNRYDSDPERNDRFFADAVSQLNEYFRGRRTRFDLKLDLDGITPFRKKVYRKLMSVRAGQVTSYGKLAGKSGFKNAGRAVGSAMASNPLPIVIPCHRVLKSDGGLGGFGGGLPLKKRLLKIEGLII